MQVSNWAFRVGKKGLKESSRPDGPLTARPSLLQRGKDWLIEGKAHLVLLSVLDLVAGYSFLFFFFYTGFPCCVNFRCSKVIQLYVCVCIYMIFQIFCLIGITKY